MRTRASVPLQGARWQEAATAATRWRAEERAQLLAPSCQMTTLISTWITWRIWSVAWWSHHIYKGPKMPEVNWIYPSPGMTSPAWSKTWVKLQLAAMPLPAKDMILTSAESSRVWMPITWSHLSKSWPVPMTSMDSRRMSPFWEA